MKKHHRWAAGIAALLMVASLVAALPRDGAALVIRDPNAPGEPPQFGDPDVPNGATVWSWWDLKVRLVNFWYNAGTRGSFAPTSASRVARSRASDSRSKDR
jgi:hypothetical protein